MTEPIYTPKNPSPTVTCAHCGAVIDRAQARPIVAQAQVGEVVDMSRRHQCADRERCEARGPIAQTAEQLRADLEAAQTVIESQRRRIDALVAEEIETRELVNAHLEELAADRRQLVADLKATRKQRDAARGAQGATATTMREELERKMRARLVREIEFVRAVRELALDGTGRPNCTINTLLSMTTKAMTAIGQDQVPEPIEEQHSIGHATILSSHCEGHPMDAPESLPSYSELEEELAAERAAHRQTAANLNAQLLPARGPRAHIVMDEDQ